MKILVVCEQGNNRSVTIASRLKYWGHDVLTAGIMTNSKETVSTLMLWADRIIMTEKSQENSLELAVAALNGRHPDFFAKFQLWDVGPDNYPRPYNRDLLNKVQRLMNEHIKEYKP